MSCRPDYFSSLSDALTDRRLQKCDLRSELIAGASDFTPIFE